MRMLNPPSIAPMSGGGASVSEMSSIVALRRFENVFHTTAPTAALDISTIARTEATTPSTRPVP